MRITLGQNPSRQPASSRNSIVVSIEFGASVAKTRRVRTAIAILALSTSRPTSERTPENVISPTRICETYPQCESLGTLRLRVTLGRNPSLQPACDLSREKLCRRKHGRWRLRSWDSELEPLSSTLVDRVGVVMTYLIGSIASCCHHRQCRSALSRRRTILSSTEQRQQACRRTRGRPRNI